jgi:hypothetical protein
MRYLATTLLVCLCFVLTPYTSSAHGPALAYLGYSAEAACDAVYGPQPEIPLATPAPEPVCIGLAPKGTLEYAQESRTFYYPHGVTLRLVEQSRLTVVFSTGEKISKTAFQELMYFVDGQIFWSTMIARAKKVIDKDGSHLEIIEATLFLEEE